MSGIEVFFGFVCLCIDSWVLRAFGFDSWVWRAFGFVSFVLLLVVLGGVFFVGGLFDFRYCWRRI